MKSSPVRRPQLWNACLALIALAAIAVGGCRREIDKVNFSRLAEGRKFLLASQPIQAVDYFEKSLDREKDTRSIANAYLLVGADMAIKQLAIVGKDSAKFQQIRAKTLPVVVADSTSLAHIMQMLNEHNVTEQSVVDVLKDLGAPAIPSMVTNMSEKPLMREMLSKVIQNMGAPVLPELQKAASDANLDPEVRQLIVRTIGSMDALEAHEALAAIRNDAAAPDGLKAEAAVALYRLGDKEQRSFLVKGLDSPDVGVRRACSYAMSFLNESPNAGILISHLKDTDAAVRKSLVFALGKHTGDASSVGSLIGVIRRDPDTEVANVASDSLEAYGAATAEPIIAAVEAEKEWQRRQRLVKVLRNEEVMKGFNPDLEFKLYEYYEKKETNDNVKRDMALVLQALEKK